MKLSYKNPLDLTKNIRYQVDAEIYDRKGVIIIKLSDGTYLDRFSFSAYNYRVEEITHDEAILFSKWLKGKELLR